MDDFNPGKLLEKIRSEEKLIGESGDILFSIVQLSKELQDELRKKIPSALVHQGIRAIIAYLEAF